MMLAQVSATVRGRVQGVGYRMFVRERAITLKLRGFVQNKADGSVYVVASGERDALEKFLEHLRIGPSHARVDAVDVQWSDAPGVDTPQRFEVRH